MTRVKICCIASPAEARVAIDAGADVLGLVSEMPSGPGVIDDEMIATIAARAPPSVTTFLLTARVNADLIAEQHAVCRTTAIQLVDHVSPVELRKLRRALPATKLVQVIHVRDESAIDEARRVADLVDAILLDSGNPAARQLGGTGRTHDWNVSARLRESIDKPVFLAGGLTPENVAEAVGVVKPFGVDVCTGVRDDGVLAPEKVRALVTNLRRAKGSRVR